MQKTFCHRVHGVVLRASKSSVPSIDVDTTRSRAWVVPILQRLHLGIYLLIAIACRAQVRLYPYRGLTVHY